MNQKRQERFPKELKGTKQDPEADPDAEREAERHALCEEDG